MIKKLATATAFVAALGMFSAAPAQAAVVGNLNDGLVHSGSTTGFWSLYVNAGDVVTVTGHRQANFDPIAVALNGPNGTGSQVGAGDDEILATPGFGGGFNDPQFTFVAGTTGEFSVGLFRFGSSFGVESLAYTLSAVGATGHQNEVPLPATLWLVGLGLGMLGWSRRRQA